MKKPEVKIEDSERRPYSCGYIDIRLGGFMVRVDCPMGHEFEESDYEIFDHRSDDEKAID